MSQGAGGSSPSDSGKAIIFRAKAKFFGQKPAAKKWKKHYFLYLLHEKRNSFCLAI